MAEPMLNMSEIIEGLSPMLSDKLSPLITIFKAVGIVLLVYIIFLILKALFSWRASHRLKIIAKNVEEINEKLDILIKKKPEEKPKAKPETEKEEKEKKLKKK